MTLKEIVDAVSLFLLVLMDSTLLCLVFVQMWISVPQKKKSTTVTAEEKFLSAPNRIFHSVLCGNIREIEYILSKNGTAVETEDDYGDTPLHLATESGNLEIIKLLLNH